MASSTETAAETLSLLEERLRRVNYVLNGHDREDTEDIQPTEVRGSAIARLRALERTLQSLASKSTTVSDVLALQQKHPDLLHMSTSSPVPSMSTSSLTSLVLAHSKLYHSISTQLPQVQDAHIPDTGAAAKLIELTPRLEQLRAKQDAQAKELAELRTRSAKAVESWYEGGVLGMGERWAEWEERVRGVEIQVRRREAAKKREEGVA